MTQPTYDPEGLSEAEELDLIRAGVGPRRDPEEGRYATEPPEGYCLGCWRRGVRTEGVRGVAYANQPDGSERPVGECPECAAAFIKAHSVDVQEALRKRDRARLRRVK